MIAKTQNTVGAIGCGGNRGRERNISASYVNLEIIGNLNRAFYPRPIWEFGEERDGRLDSGRQDTLFRRARAFFGRRNVEFKMRNSCADSCDGVARGSPVMV